MSDVVWQAEGGEVVVSRYCGPLGPPDRRRWQFLVRSPDGGAKWVDLGRTDVEDMLSALLVDVREPT